MSRSKRVLGALAIGAAALAAPRAAHGAEVSVCGDVSPLGYCVRWQVESPGRPATRGNTGVRQPATVVCYWVTARNFTGADDPTFWSDYGLTPPPVGAAVIWQTRECSDGTFLDEFRWINPTTPASLAALVNGQLLRELPEPQVESSPPLGTPSIIGVPVFVEVVNWTGIVSEEQCAGGLCVTVTATPSLTFNAGEEGAESVACEGPGTRYDQSGASVAIQASAPGACAYAYRTRTGSSGRPSEWMGSASVTWTIDWTASNGTSGTLQPVTLATALPRAVNEVQAVVVRGEPS